MKIQKQYLDNGFAQYTLMNKLNGPISFMPLVGSRWGFEKNKPVKPENYTGWLNRTPMYPTTKLANYNWRNLTLPDNTIIREEFKNILLRDSKHPIYEVVDFSKLKNLLESQLTSKHLKFMWALLSLYSYINYLNGETVKSKDLNIRIPETIVNELKSTPVTFDLTFDIFSTNKSLEVISSGKKVTVKSNSSHENDKNKYLTIFNSNISNAVRNEKTLLKERKEITFNMHLSYSGQLPLRYCLIFFDSNNKKIEAKWFNRTINKNIKNLDGSSKIPDNAETYKIAVKFPNDFSGELNVDYFFSVIQ